MRMRAAVVLTFALGLAASAMAADVSPMLVEINHRLALEGASVRVEMAEYITTSTGPEFGRTLYASDRGNKQLAYDFVPADPRRADWSAGSGITWIASQQVTRGNEPPTGAGGETRQPLLQS